MLVNSEEVCYTHGGEMSEWSIEPLSKSGRVNCPRGFESHSLRFASWRSLIVA